jgi:hypothetical protein
MALRAVSLGWRSAGLALVALLSLFVLSGPAFARNVPGSAAVVQGEIDRTFSSSLIDNILSSVRRGTGQGAAGGSAAQALSTFVDDTFENLDAYVATPALGGAVPLGDDGRSMLSLGVGAGYLFGSPDGYEFSYTAGYGTLALTHQLTPELTIFGAIISEGGRGVLEFSDGTLEHFGIGGAGGIVYRLTDTLDVSLLGGAEWLDYSTTRSDGLFTGDYQAARYFADARLEGLYEGGTFFLEYGGGLRYVHQDTEGYREFSGGIPGSYVDATEFTDLSALADVRLGAPMGAVTPFVEARVAFSLYNESGFGPIDPLDHSVSGRAGVGIEAETAVGNLTLATGVSVTDTGITGFDGSLNLGKSF